MVVNWIIYPRLARIINTTQSMDVGTLNKSCMNVSNDVIVGFVLKKRIRKYDIGTKKAISSTVQITARPYMFKNYHLKSTSTI